MKKKQNPFVQNCITAAVLVAFVVAVHAVLIRYVGGKQIVATLLAADMSTPLHHLVLAMAFILMRLIMLLLLPGIVTCILLAGWLRWRRQRVAPTD